MLDEPQSLAVHCAETRASEQAILYKKAAISARGRAVGALMLVMSVLTVVLTAPAHGANPPESKPVVLVAKPQFHDPIYGETILIAYPLGDGLHIGVILNKPTKVSLAEAFPEHGRSQKLHDPIYLG